MAKTNKKQISINALEKIMNDNYTPTEVIMWNDLEVTINKTLSLQDVLEFVNGVTKSCFSENDNSYMPEVKDFAIKCCIVQLYANFRLPSDVEQRYNLIYCTDVVDVVLKHINNEQLNEIIEAINDKVDNIAQANIEMINKQMEELYASFNNLQTQLENLFSGINSEEMSKFVGALTEGKFDEEKLVKAYVEQKKENNGE